MRRRCILALRAVQVASALVLSSPLQAQEDDPSLDLLEYLGSWDGEDEAWYVEIQIEETNDDGTLGAVDSSPIELRAEREND